MWTGDLSRLTLSAALEQLPVRAVCSSTSSEALLAAHSVWQQGLTSNKLKASQLCSSMLLPRSQGWMGRGRAKGILTHRPRAGNCIMQGQLAGAHALLVQDSRPGGGSGHVCAYGAPRPASRSRYNITLSDTARHAAEMRVGEDSGSF